MGPITRRKKRSKKLLNMDMLRSARDHRAFDQRLGGASDEINVNLEPAIAEFITELRSSEATLAISQTVDRACCVSSRAHFYKTETCQ